DTMDGVTSRNENISMKSSSRQASAFGDGGDRTAEPVCSQAQQAHEVCSLRNGHALAHLILERVRVLLAGVDDLSTVCGELDEEHAAMVIRRPPLDQVLLQQALDDLIS